MRLAVLCILLSAETVREPKNVKHVTDSTYSDIESNTLKACHNIKEHISPPSSSFALDWMHPSRRLSHRQGGWAGQNRWENKLSIHLRTPRSSPPFTFRTFKSWSTQHLLKVWEKLGKWLCDVMYVMVWAKITVVSSWKSVDHWWFIGSGIVLGISFFRFVFLGGICFSARFPCYLQHFGAGSFHFNCIYNILEFEPFIFHCTCNMLVLKLFMLHGILRLGFI